jgi:hypothetical protein
MIHHNGTHTPQAPPIPVLTKPQPKTPPLTWGKRFAIATAVYVITSAIIAGYLGWKINDIENRAKTARAEAQAVILTAAAARKELEKCPAIQAQRKR